MGTRHDPLAYRVLFEKALQQEIGLFIRIEDPTTQRKFIAALHECKRLVDLEKFEELMILTPQPPGTIYIAKKGVELP